MSTMQTTQQNSAAPNGTPTIPPLEQGDHLTREEVHRRYEAMPHVNKAELIDGVVYLPPSDTLRDCGKERFSAAGWLGQYAAFTPGTQGGVYSSIFLDWRNEPQPDAFLIISPECGGQVQIDAEGYIVGAPELINETSVSSASYDLHSKLEAYRRNRVREYVVWRVLERAIDWFILEGDRFARSPCDHGVYRSRVFPGLWLDVQALLDGNLLKVFEVVQKGVATEEHRRFVASLQNPG